MSRQYQDPYYAPEHRNYNSQQPYTDAPFDPYNTHQAHPTYDQSGYQDDDAYRNANPVDRDGVGHSREKSEFDNGFSTLRPPKPTGGLRIWRKDNHGPLWTSGGRGKCIFRFCCCSILIFFFLVVSIGLTLLIWIRPPNITINQVGLNSTSGSAVSVTSSTLKMNFAVNISVDNPNYFKIAFDKIKVNLTYPTNGMDLGGGEKDDVDFNSDTQTTFNFPFALEYNLSEDSSQTVLKDLLSKCGITGTKEDISVDFKITLGLKILFATVSPSFSNSFNFECPTDEIESFLQSSGLGSIGSFT